MRSVVVVLLLAMVAACRPGGEGWECEVHVSAATFDGPSSGASSDCRDGLVCRSMGGYSAKLGNVTKSVCVAPNATGTSSTYNWLHVIASWAIGFIVVLSLVIAITKKLAARRQSPLVASKRPK